MSPCSSRVNRIVPVAVEAMPFEADRGHLRVGDGDAARIVAAIEFRSDAEPRPAVRRANQAHDGREVHERRAAPVHRDVREQAMLDLVPLARARRKVTDRDGEPGAIGELLQFPLPEPEAGPVAPAGIGRDQQRLRVRDTRVVPCAATSGGSPARRSSPCRDRCRRSPSLHCAADRRRRTESLCRPASWWRGSRSRGRAPAGASSPGATPRPPFLKSPTSSFFFVSTEIVGCRCRCDRANDLGDVPKLRVAIGMLAALARLDVALEAVAEGVQQLRDHRVADVMAQPVQRHGQRAHAPARPAQRRIGIAGRRRLHQRVQVPQQRRVGDGRPLASATGGRLRDGGRGRRTCRSRSPRWIVDAAIPVARATSAMPP